MRISTSQYYSSSVQTMDNQQSQLLQLEQELSTSTSLATPADNPLGAAQAVSLSVTSATLTQYTSNQSTALSQLGLEDSTLSSVTTTMQSMASLLEEAGNGTLSDTDRAAMAQQLTGDRNQLMTLANTTDGSGNYIFAGFQSGSQPFTNAAGGGVTYSGDSGQITMQVSGTRQIATNDSGSSVFMSVPAYGTSPVASGAAANTGTGTIGAVSITDPTVSTNGDSYSIVFGGTSTAPTYTVTDNTTSPPTVGTAQAYTAGSPISLGSGMTVAVSGTPAAGDSFSVQPATKAGTDIFQTIDSVIAALNTPVSNNPAAAATLTNTLNAATTQLNNSMTNVTTIHASVGGREQELQALQTATSTTALQTTSNLQDLTSANMVQVISQYEQVQNSLSASQKSFVQIQQLSLFQYIDT